MASGKGNDGSRRRTFRAAYEPAGEPQWGRLRPLVIGMYGRLNGMVDAPPQVSDYFIYFSYEDVSVPTDNATIHLPAYALLIVPPDMPVRHGKVDGYWRRSWLRCRGWAIGEMIQDCGLPEGTPLLLSSPELHERYLNAMNQEMHHSRGPEAANIELLFRLWMREVRREAMPNAVDPVPERFLMARDFIEEHYLAAPSLDQIAAEVNLSKSQLCRGFRRHLKTSPIDYALRLRLEHATDLLDNVDLNISEVAIESGFRDIFYFSRCFKQHFGASPSSYRKQRGAVRELT